MYPRLDCFNCGGIKTRRSYGGDYVYAPDTKYIVNQVYFYCCTKCNQRTRVIFSIVQNKVSWETIETDPKLLNWDIKWTGE